MAVNQPLLLSLALAEDAQMGKPAVSKARDGGP
jgi:hypothetical protein